MSEQDTTGILSEEDNLVEDYVDDIRHVKNRNVSFNEYKKRVIKSMSFLNQAKQEKQIKDLDDQEIRIKQHNKKEGERIKKMRKYDTR